MINVASYWTLPPSRQGKIRAKIEKAEQDMQKVVGYYARMEIRDCVEFTLFCYKCYNIKKWLLYEEYTPMTKKEYINQSHEMHGETCSKCDNMLV